MPPYHGGIAFISALIVAHGQCLFLQQRYTIIHQRGGNFVNAVAVGAVAGAGGIGYQLFLAGSFYYNIHEVGLIVYLCLAVAVVLEVAATQLRKRYIVQH